MSNSSSFKPHPYTFRLIDCYDHPMIVDTKFRDKIIAQSPPFHILLDHTIGVLWNLFSLGKECDLRSSQICWALKFLEGMHNDSRARLYSEDVRKAVRLLESAFVNRISSEYVSGMSKRDEDPMLMTPMCSKKLSKCDEDSKEPNVTGHVELFSQLAENQDDHKIQSILLRDMLKKGQEPDLI